MILDEIVAFKKLQVEEEKKKLPQIEFRFQEIVPRNFKQALTKEGMSIIAEIKKASPSKGIIKENFDVVKIGEVYAQINIDAVSVLTEKEFFKGEDSSIQKVKRVNSKPILRKDFIIDEYQIYQSKAIYADAVLLIVAILGDKLRPFYKLATELGLSCLVEVHDEQELYKAIEARCEIIGINNRDLRDFSVELKTSERLISKIPEGITVVSESGIKTLEDIKYLRSIGVDGVLVGETFMRQIEEIDRIKKFVNDVKELG